MGADAAVRVAVLGYGLAGIRERVDLLGGRFAVGPDDGEWVLRVALPAGR